MMEQDFDFENQTLLVKYDKITWDSLNEVPLTISNQYFWDVLVHNLNITVREIESIVIQNRNSSNLQIMEQ